MSEKIVLIDGHSMINRAFYGVPPLTNSKGLHTNAIYGFMNIMLKVIDEEKPQYLLVAFDLKAPTFRHSMYSEYKGTRKPMPSELHEQVPVLKELLSAMDIPLMSKEGYEADDILGTMARKAEEDGLEVCILSGDRDLLQLATDKTKIRLPHTKGGKSETDDFYASDVLEKYRVSPKGIIELKALMGDSSDNIPGVPKIGEKTATDLVIQYGNIENLKPHIEEISKKSIRETLLEHFDMAEMSKKLATIDVYADLPFDYRDGRIDNIYTAGAYAKLKELEIKKLLDRFSGDVLNEVPVKKTDAIAINDFAKANEIFDRLIKLDEDKTASFLLLSDKGGVAGFSCAFDVEELFFVPIEGFVTYDYVLSKVYELITVGTGRYITFGLKDQLAVFRDMYEAAIENSGRVFDVKLMSYILNPLKSEYTIEDIAQEQLNTIIESKKQLFDKLSFCDAYESQADKLLQYAGNSVYTCLASFEVLNEKLCEVKMDNLFYNIEMPLLYCLSDMEKQGVLVLREELSKYSKELGKRIDELEKRIYEQAGEEFNINSPKQLGEILFVKMQLPGGKKTKTGYSTAADVLEKLADETPIIADILEYRGLAKLKSTYADGLAEYISEDGRIHSTFHQTVTATGRLSSADPNLQNIPVRTQEGRLFRKVFVPKDGYVFVDADYSQIELRILAAMSGDKKLIEAYNMDQDIHRITASQVFGVPFEEVTDQLRRNAKAVNFGIVYGISSFGLSQDLSIGRKEAAEYIKNYFQTYPEVKRFLDELVSSAKEKGYVETLWGRRRPVPEINVGNFMQKQFGERVAMNAPIQGTAADIIKIAMIGVYNELKNRGLDSKLILQVHDELLIETKESELSLVCEILKEQMMNAASLSVSLVADVKSGNSWYEVH